MMLGMGDDGHTASIFPHEMKLWYSDENCVAATHPVSGQKRISLTGKVINASSNIAFLITGENKAQKVKEIIEQSENAEDKYPAALVQPDSGNLSGFWTIRQRPGSPKESDSRTISLYGSDLIFASNLSLFHV